MFAVIKTGGKQYKVAKNDVITVEKLPGAAGSDVRLTDVVMVHDGTAATVGTPRVDGAAVSATVVEQGRGDKVIVFKKKRRKKYRRTKGHRQAHTVLQITDIVPHGASAPTDEAKPKRAAAETAAAKPVAAKKPAAKKPARAATATEAAAKKPVPRKAAPRAKKSDEKTKE
jgi:large subunit ribosomal protein L21